MANRSFDALIFDMNGTMIDDMLFHVKAWSYMLNNELGAGLTEAQVKAEMYGKNGEVLDRIFGKGHFTAQESDRLSVEKEKRYQADYLPHLALINGLPSFLEKIHQQGIPMAIGSAAIPFNIDFVLDNLNLRHYFAAIVSADDVTISKPHPETYVKAAALLNVPAAKCLVFEDAPKGVEAALNAGMQAVAITTLHTPDEFARYNNIVAFIKDYTDPVLEQILV
ncbi:MAG: HAD family hydrolase [Agriterribacter sp.]